MGWLHKLLNGESDDESVPATPNPDHLVPPPLPQLGRHDPAAGHKRAFASKVCPSCGAAVKQLSHSTEPCETCGEPIVVRSGEDGQWHLMRDVDIMAFEERQEQIRIESYKADEAALLEAGYLAGDQQVDVTDEADYQETLERLAGGRTKSGAIKGVVALLSREPERHHQKDAVRIDVGNETVGYIDRADAKEIQPLMQKLEQADRPAWVRAWIVGGWEDDRGDNNFRVRLDGLPKVN